MSCCPSFLLAGAGPHLSVYGVVKTDKFIVQHLTDIHLGQATTYEDQRAHRIAKVFFSLRRARETLDDYYRAIGVPTPVGRPAPDSKPENIPLPCFFPYPAEFTGPGAEPTEFEYIDVPDADPTNVTFFAEVIEPGPRRKLVVKFVDRYGVEAHETLAEKGMAPRLLYYGTLDGRNDLRASGNKGTFEQGLYIGPLRMVVMEHIRCEGRSCWPDDAREQVKKAIDLLHKDKLVFGDLRPPNVLFSGGKVFLIDFDWAGKEEEVRYPHGLSTDIQWGDRVENLEGELIEYEHDSRMLELLFLPAQSQSAAAKTN